MVIGSPPRRHPTTVAWVLRRTLPSVCLSGSRRSEAGEPRIDSNRLNDRSVVWIPSTSLDAIPSVRCRHHTSARDGGVSLTHARSSLSATPIRSMSSRFSLGVQPVIRCGMWASYGSLTCLVPRQ